MTTCATCGKPIVQRYDGTFWKAPEPLPMAWFHDLGVGAIVRWSRACGWAAPATASEGATATFAGRLMERGVAEMEARVTGVTSSDGDRGLSEERQ